jgi:hypothetical protein
MRQGRAVSSSSFHHPSSSFGQAYLPFPFFTNRKRGAVRRERLFLLYRILVQNPFIPATLEYFDILEACACELLRHTGAGGLVESGAI